MKTRNTSEEIANQVSLNYLETDKEKGLSLEEAELRLKKFGTNSIKKTKKINPFFAFLRQFKDLMVILLLFATVFSLSIAIYEIVDFGFFTRQTAAIISFVEPAIILLVVILNSMLGSYQEIKSDQAVRALEKLNELNAKVIRNKRLILIPASQIVPGDILVVEAGDTISADATLFESSNLMVVESSLTGESLAIEKSYSSIVKDNAPLGDQKNKIFSGTYVTNGRGLAIVYATGEKTEIGKINVLIQDQKKNVSPLQLKINKLGRLFGISGIVLLVVTALAQILLDNFLSGNWVNISSYTNSIVTAISLAVAAIPEGLITFTTVILAIGVAKMTKENAIVKSLPSIETLGSANIVCSDKTGTLTENKMVVVDMMFKDKIFAHDPKNLEYFKPLITNAVLCTDADLHLNENNEFEEVGDPTEIGLLLQGFGVNIKKNDIQKNNPRIASLPFDSDRKMMSVLIQYKDYNLMITKGAPNEIINKSISGTKGAFDINEKWSNLTFRVLAFAVKKFDKSKTTITFEDENNLEFIGLIAMQDPPRANVKDSIFECLSAGIKPVMITGDHLTTAVAIAKNLGIYKDGDKAINGYELSKMTQEQLENYVHNISVYARVNPKDKLRIVKAWQKHQKVVVMTGDGVNDAPALKASDIGCAMGITGTDVSKQAADVVLTDDNFNTIVKAIKSGREIFDKIKTVILNLLISSLSEIIVMLLGLFVFRFVFINTIGNNTEFFVLSASQLLWINILTHGLPAMALGMVHSGDNVMNREPFNKTENIFSRGMGFNLIFQSLVLSFLSLLAYGIVGSIAQSNGVEGLEFVRLTSTACFITLGVGSSINSLNLMTKKSIFISNVYNFRLVYFASIFSFSFVLFAAFVPGVRTVFRMLDISSFNHDYITAYWLLPLGLGFGLMATNELLKLYKNKFKSINKTS